VINYDGRRFRRADAGTDDVPIGHYHQEGDLLWGEASGGAVRRCALTGRVDEHGTITLGYTMLLDDGRIVVGRCVTTPETAADGSLRLREEWERYLPVPDTGVSYMEEVRPVGSTTTDTAGGSSTRHGRRNTGGGSR
jgi:hypothetical protein